MKAYCNRHYTGYEVSLGCLECNAEASERTAKKVPDRAVAKDEPQSSVDFTAEERWVLSSMGIDVSNESNDVKRDFRQLLTSIFSVWGSDSDSDQIDDSSDSSP